MMNKGEPLTDNQIIVYEELPLSEESVKEACKNRQLLCDNPELILANADKIISPTRFTWCKGVVGEQVLDQILEDVVDRASLAAMIESL